MPNPKRKRCSVSEIQNIISAQKVSGQSQETFCKEQQIPISTFTNWIRKQRAKSLSNLPTLIPVGSVPASCPAIEIELPGGEIIRLESGVIAADLKTVLGVLNQC